jgi:hypothetical protein
MPNFLTVGLGKSQEMSPNEHQLYEFQSILACFRSVPMKGSGRYVEEFEPDLFVSFAKAIEEGMPDR